MLTIFLCPEFKELEWRQEHSKTFPRPNTRPTHVSGCPRVGMAWKNNLIVIGYVPGCIFWSFALLTSIPSVEPSSSKRSHQPYASPKRKSNGPKTSRSPANFFKQSASQSHSLNIWQYSVQNRTWAKHNPTTNPPQGDGPNFPTNLAGCIVGENIACVAIQRDEGTCIWSLDLLCPCYFLFLFYRPTELYAFCSLDMDRTAIVLPSRSQSSWHVRRRLCDIFYGWRPCCRFF